MWPASNKPPLKRLLRGGAALLIVALTAGCPANHSSGQAAAKPQEAEYALVSEPSPPPNPQRIRVQEFFWYGCPHCFAAEPYLNDWLKTKPADVDFERVPDTLGRPVGEVHQRAYYIAQVLGVSALIHEPLFNALHVQHLQILTMNDLRGFFEQAAGVKPQDFDAAAGSATVADDVQRADQLALRYGIDSVPTLVVGGKYETDPERSRTLAALPKVLDMLIAKVRDERKS